MSKIWRLDSVGLTYLKGHKSLKVPRMEVELAISSCVDKGAMN